MLGPAAIIGLDEDRRPFLGVADVWRIQHAPHDLTSLFSHIIAKSRSLSFVLFAEVRNDAFHRTYGGHCCSIDFFVIPGVPVDRIVELDEDQVATLVAGRSVANALRHLWAGEPDIQRPEIPLDDHGHDLFLSHYIFTLDEEGMALRPKQGWLRQAQAMLRFGLVSLIRYVLDEGITDSVGGPGFMITYEGVVSLEDVADHFSQMRNPL